MEVNGHGTGGAVADLDGDGQVELLLSHGESASEPLTFYNVTEGGDNNFVRYYRIQFTFILIHKLLLKNVYPTCRCKSQMIFSD